MARRLIPEASAADAFGERETRYEPPLDKPTPAISLLIAQIHDTRAYRIELLFHVTFEKIEWLV
jgi:hypothetical protein